MNWQWDLMEPRKENVIAGALPVIWIDASSHYFLPIKRYLKWLQGTNLLFLRVDEIWKLLCKIFREFFTNEEIDSKPEEHMNMG